MGLTSSFEPAKATVDGKLLAYGTDHACRTTGHADLFGVDELLDLAQALAQV